MVELCVHKNCPLCGRDTRRCLLPDTTPAHADPDLYLKILNLFDEGGCVVSGLALEVLRKLDEQFPTD